MDEFERKVADILHNLNWLMKPHDSYAELIEAKDNRVVIRCIGHCAGCETDCVRIAFKDRLPDIDLIIQ
jgi:Fe-S cluster biogenesis protein NfuA